MNKSRTRKTLIEFLESEDEDLADKYLNVKKKRLEEAEINWSSIAWSCFHCNYIFKDFKSFSIHQQSKHQIIKVEDTCYQCNECGESVFKYTGFLNHIRSAHSEVLKLCCDVCNETFQDYMQLAFHRDKHIGVYNIIQPSVYHCSLCEIVYPTEKCLKHHIQQEHGLKTVNCEEDDEERPQSPINLDDHHSLSSNHCKDEFYETQPLFKYGTCVKNFSNECDLERKRGTKPKQKRRSMWSKDEDELFLNCWKMFQLELQKCQRKSHIYQKMAEEMEDKFSPEEIKIKLKNFTQRYRREKREIDPPGGSSSKWRYYNQVHEIIGGNTTDSNLAEKNIENSLDTSDLSDMSNTDPLEVSPPLPLHAQLPLSSTSSISSAETSTPSTSRMQIEGRKEKAAPPEDMDFIKEQGDMHLAIFRRTLEDNKAMSQKIVNLLTEQKQMNAKMLVLLEKLVEKSSGIH